MDTCDECGGPIGWQPRCLTCEEKPPQPIATAMINARCDQQARDDADLLDRFAANAMPRGTAAGEDDDEFVKRVAEGAYHLAAALMQERARRRGQEKP